MTIVHVEIYQNQRNGIFFGLSLNDKYEGNIKEKDIFYWLAENIIHKRIFKWVGNQGFNLNEKIFINFLDNKGTNRQYTFNKTKDETKRLIKFEEEYFFIERVGISGEKINNLTPYLDTISFSTIQKNGIYSFLICSPTGH